MNMHTGHYLKYLNKAEDVHLEKNVQVTRIANIGMIGLGILSLLILFIKKIGNLKFYALHHTGIFLGCGGPTLLHG